MSSSSSDDEVRIVGPALQSVAMKTKRLFLVRHGEVINPGGDRSVYYGSQDVELSTLGKQEATAAGEYLQQFNLQLVASSPLSRAVFGAKEILSLQSNEKDLTISVEPGFTELDRGAWRGKTKGEIGLDLLQRFDACDLAVTPEGGESYPELKERVIGARDRILSMIEFEKSAAIVSHLQVTRSMLSEAMGIPASSMASLKVLTASVTCIDYHEDGTQTVQFQSFKPNVGLDQAKDGAN
eukprot:CAMPEP_0194136102 /NCGR_PEP_ID=MMETSP0152-20130528/6129_1 /TAXON_ID=1049557 /ORGANISM="Thalassiothrix antarctica, Strain L6-D1" /LENGTH=238 /DNA_ID=CAMNT_0038832615 /DNA_START=155 /DNA_END=871 /DNA_ORIENTATION=+